MICRKSVVNRDSVHRDCVEGRPMQTTPRASSEMSPDGGFIRQPNAFTARITADGSSGYLAEPGRSQLYASLAAPWAQRTLIVRRLLGLERIIGVSLTDALSDERGGRF